MPILRITIEEEKKRKSLRRSKSVSRSFRDNHDLNKISDKQNRQEDIEEEKTTNKTSPIKNQLKRSSSLPRLPVNNIEVINNFKEPKKLTENEEAKKKLLLINKRIKQSKSPSKSRNKFEKLIKKDDKQEKDENAVSVPSIILHDPQDYHLIMKELEKYVKHGFYTNLSKTGIKILFKNEKDFNKLKTYYEENDYVFHVCLCKNDKKLSVAIKGIPSAINTDEILKDLKQKFPIITINRVLNKFKQPSAMCYVEVVNNQAGKEIFKLEYLLHSKVIVEKWKSERKELCTNCQKFKIKKIPIQNTVRCSKCKGNHHYTECTLLKINTSNKTETVLCKFCEGQHDNYKHCPYYEKIVQDIKNDNKKIDFHSNKNTTETTLKSELTSEGNEKTSEEQISKICENNKKQNDKPVEQNETSSILLNNSTILFLLFIYFIVHYYIS